MTGISRPTSTSNLPSSSWQRPSSTKATYRRPSLLPFPSLSKLQDPGARAAVSNRRSDHLGYHLLLTSSLPDWSCLLFLASISLRVNNCRLRSVKWSEWHQEPSDLVDKVWCSPHHLLRKSWNTEDDDLRIKIVIWHLELVPSEYYIPIFHSSNYFHLNSSLLQLIYWIGALSFFYWSKLFNAVTYLEILDDYKVNSEHSAYYVSLVTNECNKL